MTKGNQFKRALALSTALSVVALGATTTAADAALNPGKSQGQSQSTDKSQATGQDNAAKGHDKKATAKPSPSKSGSTRGSSTSSPGNGEAKGHDKTKDKDQGTPDQPSTGGGGPSQDGSTAGSDKGGKGGDPAGNNGTVKITPHGEVDGIPQNTPHVGCDFDVEWYGFDEGADIISTVTFEAWAPTRGTLEVVEGDLSVFVGADPASGAGVGSDADGTDADNGFDGEERYVLAFPGIEPHPQQGYHVKLTIHTPGSQGADTKHKVFWVEGCEDETSPGEEEVPEVEVPDVEVPDVEVPEVEGEEGTNNETDNDSDVEVLGEQGTDTQVSGAQGGATLPTAVDAGLASATWVATPTPLYVALFGAILAGLGLLVRRRFN